MTRWYRAYAGTVSDAKLGEAALVAECSRSVAIAIWHALLEDAAETNDGGRFETTARRIAAMLGEPLKTVDAVLAAFDEIGLKEGNVVAAWKKRQYESDNSTERSRQHRQRKRDGGATLQQQQATPPETETETELAEEPSGSSGAVAPRTKSLGDLVWQIGPNFLAEHGCPERQARSLLGKWRKERGDAETLAALIAAERESVSEPVAWIEARLKNGGRQRKNGASTSTERWDSILAGGLESIGYLCGDDGVWRGPDGETIHDPGGSGLPS